MKFGIVQSAEVIAVKTSTYSLTANDSGSVYSNEGAGSSVTFNLPTPIVGLTYSFIVEDADGITVVADATSTIRTGSYITSAGGYINSNTIGNVITLTAVSTIEWISIKKLGTFYIPGAGAMYTGGGYNGSFQSGISKLTNDTTCASITATLSLGKARGEAATISNSAYFAGGCQLNGSNPQNVIDKLISDTSCSAVSATLSIARYDYTSGVISSSAYFGGGANNVTPYSNTIDKLTNDTACAAISATIATTRSQSAGGVINSTFYIAGKYDGNYFNTIDKMTSSETTAAVTATLSASNAAFAAAAIGSSLYFMGGQWSPTNRIDKLTNDTTCASVAATLARTGGYGSATTFNSAVYHSGTDVNYNAIDKLTNDTTCASITATLGINAGYTMGALAAQL